MTDEEVNKIIADYNGTSTKFLSNFELFEEGRSEEYDVIRYTKSLDSLVPVWEKLKKDHGTEMIMGIQIFDYNGSPWNCEFETRDSDDKIGNSGICIEHPSKSAFKSAAYATAKAILELKKELNV